ncbi:hypothetical protein [Actinokineospora pegani]|uniref:hypothetical protein n=1 Tax=Actinokineospora pegani TaxID=2654637 RepID=UPI0012EABECF|nr:hypothetical protein [Actinokineospora pegani]
MFEPIVANYTPDGDDWKVEVTGGGQVHTETAPGLVAARDEAERLAERIAPGDQPRTIVHTIDGDALEFTTAYLNARLGRPPAEPEQAAG